MNVLSIFLPISPPRASISLTRCPLELPPIFGLHGISAILSTLTVKITVSKPSRAQARAASQPACPAPTTTTSTFSSTTGIYMLLYFPIQNLLKISLARSSSISSPMTIPSDLYAFIKSIEKKSSGIPSKILPSTNCILLYAF